MQGKRAVQLPMSENIHANDQLVLRDGEIVRTEEVNKLADDDQA